MSTTDLRIFTAELKSHVDLRRILESLGIEVDRHSRCRCISPSHDDKHPSMLVYDDHIHCMQCGFREDVIEVVGVLKGFSFRESVDWICEYVGLEKFGWGDKKRSDAEMEKWRLQKERSRQVYDCFEDAALIYAQNQNDYLTRRGISAEVQKQFRVGYAGSGKYFLKDILKEKYGGKILELLLNKHGQDFFRNRCVIPIADGGRIVNFYGRDLNPKGNKDFRHMYLGRNRFETIGVPYSLTLFGFDSARAYRSLYMTEGIIDFMTLRSHELPNSVGIYGTQGLRPEHLKQLKRARVEKIILCLDGDDAGMKSMVKYGGMLEEQGFLVSCVLLPTEEDVNSFFRSNGKEAFEQLRQVSPLTLAISMIDANLNGIEFHRALLPALTMVSKYDSTVRGGMLAEIKRAFPNHNLSLPELRKIVEKIEAERDRPAVRVATDDEPEYLEVRKFLPDAPLSSEIYMPKHWFVDDLHGLRKQIVKNDEILYLVACSVPVFITGILQERSSVAETIRLTWRRRGKWRSILVDRDVLASTRRIVDLAKFGLPITSLTSGLMVEYLQAFEALNIESLPEAYVSPQMGAQQGAGFIYGRSYIDSKGNWIKNLDAIDPLNWDDDTYIYRGQADGDDQLADAFYQEGTYEKWLEAIKKIVPFDCAMMTLYASMSSPLLSILGAPNYVVSIDHISSRGKSILMDIVGSVWGNPEERAPNSVHFTWEATKVWIEGTLGALNSMTLILDDTKRAKSNPKKISDLIYDLTSGKGRGRGNASGGNRRSTTWRAVMISTGEAEITSFSQDGGARARVLEYWGEPFGEVTSETGELVNSVDQAVKDNFGHVAPMFISWLYRNRGRWPEWKEEWRALSKKYKETYPDNPYTGRISDYAATVEICENLAHECFDFPWKKVSPMDRLFEQFSREAKETDRSRAAMECVYDYCFKHSAEFLGRHDTVYDSYGHVVNIKSKPIIGRWDDSGDWKYIAILPTELEALLAKFDFDVRATIKNWEKKGWLGKDYRGYTKVAVKWEGRENKRCYKILRRALVEIGEVDPVDVENEEAMREQGYEPKPQEPSEPKEIQTSVDSRPPF